MSVCVLPFVYCATPADRRKALWDGTVVILHLAEHIQHIRGVTNPFLTARTFQRDSVPVNNTSPGFHTSELMCVWHTQIKRSLARQRATRRKRPGRLDRKCARLSVWSCRVSVASLKWLMRRGCQSVRLASVKSPPAALFLCWHLLTSVYHLSHTPLLLTLATPQLSKDLRRIHYSDCPCKGSLQRRKDYIMRWHI